MYLKMHPTGKKKVKEQKWPLLGYGKLYQSCEYIAQNKPHKITQLQTQP